MCACACAEVQRCRGAEHHHLQEVVGRMAERSVQSMTLSSFLVKEVVAKIEDTSSPARVVRTATDSHFDMNSQYNRFP